MSTQGQVRSGEVRRGQARSRGQREGGGERIQSGQELPDGRDLEEPVETRLLGRVVHVIHCEQVWRKEGRKEERRKGRREEGRKGQNEHEPDTDKN